jgi:hypothetical protein
MERIGLAMLGAASHLIAAAHAPRRSLLRVVMAIMIFGGTVGFLFEGGSGAKRSYGIVQVLARSVIPPEENRQLKRSYDASILGVRGLGSGAAPNSSTNALRSAALSIREAAT